MEGREIRGKVCKDCGGMLLRVDNRRVMYCDWCDTYTRRGAPEPELTVLGSGREDAAAWAMI